MRMRKCEIESQKWHQKMFSGMRCQKVKQQDWQLGQEQVEFHPTKIAVREPISEESESVRMRDLSERSEKRVFQSHENQTVRLSFSQVKQCGNKSQILHEQVKMVNRVSDGRLPSVEGVKLGVVSDRKHTNLFDGFGLQSKSRE